MLRRTRSGAGDAATASPVKGPVKAPAEETAWRLERAGLVDRAWCEAIAGQRFDSDLAAATYIVQTHPGRWTTHPLLCVDAFPEWLRERLAVGDHISLLRCLRRNRSRGTLGPLVDLTTLPGTPEEREQVPGGGLALFLASADDDTPLPGHPHLTLGAARTAMVAAAAAVTGQLALGGPRTTQEWDHEAERRWRDRWSTAPLPERDGAPLVSIVMPVRNRPRIVEHALASVTAQSLTSWELLVVDDGSTDETLATLQRWAADDPRIRVLSQAQGGVCAARNHGLAAATGHYVAFLDSDNVWRPDFLRLAVAAMHGEGHRAAYAGMVLRDQDDPEHPRYRAFRAGHEHLMVVNHVDLNVMVVERALVEQSGGFDESLRRWVDHDFALRVSALVDLTLLPFIAVDYDDTRGIEQPTDRITTRESESWQYVVLGQHWVSWPQVQAEVADRVAGRVSVVIPTWNDATMTLRAVNRLVSNTPDTDLEIIVLDNGSRPEVSMRLAAAALVHPAMSVVRLPRNLNFAIGCNVGFARSTGEHVLFLNNDTEVRPGWLPPLLEALGHDDVLGVQPLLLYPDDSVQAAGTVFPVAGSLPLHFLAGHPPEDAERMTDHRFPVVTAAAVLLRATDVATLRGFDPIFVNGMEDVDLCLRAGELRPGHFRVVTESRVTHHEGKTPGRGRNIATNRVTFHQRWAGRLPAAEPWRWTDVGFEVAHVGGDGLAVPSPRLVLRRPARYLPDETPVLRWGLRSPAPGGQSGTLWGDTHFIDSLARGLRAQGQEVVTYRNGTFADPVTAYDDVVLGIRGLVPIGPVPGKVNALWIISHPDDVDPDELLAFDLVYAASAVWAARLAERIGRPVRALLQATDTERRPALTGPAGDGRRPVFVGGAPRDRVRPIVRDAVDQGVPVVVHGPHWEGKIPDAARGLDYVLNDQLLQTYRASGLVLSDHWADMARTGFVSNRVYDALAAGARVITDPIDGIEIFDGAVQAYHSPEELAELCSPAGRHRFPDDETMARISERVATEHSFDARARTLLADVLALRAGHAG